MSSTRQFKTVAGESLALLERAERHVHLEPVEEGLRIRADLPPNLRAPFVRALMRVEAKILTEYADASTADPGAPLPDCEKLHAHAVATLLQRIAHGTDAPPQRPSREGR